MDLTTILLTLVVCYLIYWLFIKPLSIFKENDIPYMPGIPIFGNMLATFTHHKHFSTIVHDIYKVDPDAAYVGAFDFLRPIIVLRDPELIKAIAIKNFDNFPDHFTFIDPNVNSLVAGNLFNVKGAQWKETRNLLTPAFTGSKMKNMYELMINCAKTMVEYVDTRKPEELKMVDTKNLFTRYTSDVIATCAFGVGIDSLNNPNNEFYTNGRKAANVENSFKIKFFFARFLPTIVKMLRIRFIDEKCENFFKSLIGETVATRDEKNITRPDMVQLLMDARKRNLKNLNIDITEITAQAFLFIFAGFEVTAGLMSIMAHELTINGDVQSRLQEEIDQVMRDTNGKPTYEVINNLPYLDAIVNETMRMHTQNPFLERLCTKEFELPPSKPGRKPFTVKPGMNVWIPSVGIHKDPKYYENPDKFDPSRYFNKKINNNDAMNLGFGIGPRNCIGNRFAILETKILFFFFLSKFNLQPNAKTALPFVYSKKHFDIRPEEGFWLSVERRAD